MVCEHRMSERHACALVGLSRDSYRHVGQTSALNLELRDQIVQTAHTRRRWGYRMIHDVLRPQYPGINHKRVYRLYSEQGLSLRHKRPKRNKAAQLRQPKTLAQRINQICSMDFVADNLFDGRKLRMLTVMDCYTRESLAIHVGQRLKGEDVVRVLNAIVHDRGQSQTIKTDNAMVESFNGRLRQECLNEHWFMSLADAQDKIEAWRRFYNEARPHSALDWQTPSEFARQTRLQPCLSRTKEPEVLTSER